MKNKKLLFVVGISLVVSLLLTGCIGEDPEQKARDKVEEFFTAWENEDAEAMRDCLSDDFRGDGEVTKEEFYNSWKNDFEEGLEYEVVEFQGDITVDVINDRKVELLGDVYTESYMDGEKDSFADPVQFIVEKESEGWFITETND